MIDPLAPDYALTPVADRRPAFRYAPLDPASPPAVSIVTPFFNTGPVFEETARSVERQSFQQWEWIIVNDGSTDAESLAVLEAYRQRDARVRVIDHPQNLGLSAARNTGFRAARAPYVLQLDSDDMLETTALEKWYWFLESHPECAFVKGFTVGFGAEQYLWRKGFHEGPGFLEENLVSPTALVRKLVHEEVAGYDESVRAGLEDWEFWLRCANAGHWGATVPEYLDWYRRRDAHWNRWQNVSLGKAERFSTFRAKLRSSYPGLWEGGFPSVAPAPRAQGEAVPEAFSCGNRLQKSAPRVLMLLPWFAIGGADKFNLDVVRQFRARGWEVSIATTLQGDHPWLTEFTRHTPDVFVLERFLRVEEYPRFLRYLIGSRQVDAVLVSHSEVGYLLLPYLRAHCPDVTFVDYCHVVEPAWKDGGYPRMSVEAGDHLDLRVVSSEDLRDWMIAQGAPADRIRVCHTGIDTELWRPDDRRRADIRRELWIEDGVPMVLCVGRICEQKQPEVFAATIGRLRERGVGVVAVVAGDGPDLRALQDGVTRHRIKRMVRLLGAVSNERVRELMGAADVFFLPSKWEGVSLAIYEAMACGVPVVGAAVGGQRELVTPECGVLVEPCAPAAQVERYAEALALLATDPARRVAMGQAARARTTGCFKVESMADRLIELLREAEGCRCPAPPPDVSAAAAQTSAARAVACARAFESHASVAPEGEPTLVQTSRWYFALRRLLLPVYEWGLDHGWLWLLPARDVVRGFLTKRL